MTVTAHHTIAPNITRPTKPLRVSVSGVQSGVIYERYSALTLLNTVTVKHKIITPLNMQYSLVYKTLNITKQSIDDQ